MINAVSIKTKMNTERIRGIIMNSYPVAKVSEAIVRYLYDKGACSEGLSWFRTMAAKVPFADDSTNFGYRLARIMWDDLEVHFPSHRPVIFGYIGWGLEEYRGFTGDVHDVSEFDKTIGALFLFRNHAGSLRGSEVGHSFVNLVGYCLGLIAMRECRKLVLDLEL